jgi:hypothetical protein
MRRILAVLLLAASASSVSARNLFIPVAGAVPGIGNTYFRTDIRIFNPSFSKDIDVSIHFLPQGQDNSNIPGQLFHVPKRQMIVLDNVVGSLYGWTPPLLGALRIDSDGAADYNVIVDSRTYTDSPNPAAPGTYGQFIPALDIDTAVKKSIVVHVSSSPDYRTNVVFMNPQRVPATITASLVFPDGALVTPEATITVPPMSMIQRAVPVLFDTTRSFADAFLHVDSDQPVFSGVSVIDNHSSDQFFVPGVEDRDEVRPLPF